MNEDCSAGFRCLDNLPGSLTGDGCLVECDPGFVMVPQFSNAGSQVELQCISETVATVCPGAYNIECALDPIDPVGEDCICNGELFVSPDCT